MAILQLNRPFRGPCGLVYGGSALGIAYASALWDGYQTARQHQLAPDLHPLSTDFLWRGCNEAHQAIARIASIDCRVTPADPGADIVIISPHPTQPQVQEIGWAVMGPLLGGQPEIVIGKPNYNGLIRNVLLPNGLTIIIDQKGGPGVRDHIRSEVQRLAELHLAQGRSRLAFHIYADGHRPIPKYLQRSRAELREIKREDLIPHFERTCHPRPGGALSIIRALTDLGRKVEVHYVDLVTTKPQWWDPSELVGVTITTTSQRVDPDRVREWLVDVGVMKDDLYAYWIDHNRRKGAALMLP